MKLIKLVCIAISCLFVLGAGVAQAREWKIKEKGLEELKVKSETIKGKIGTAKIVVPSLSLTIECTSGSTESFSIKTAGQAEGSIALTGCSVPSSKFCTVKPITLKVFGELTERNGVVYVAFRPQAGSFGLVQISESCALAETSQLTGNLAAEAKGTEKTEQALPFSAATAKGAETKLKFGANAATFEASLTGSLSGAHAGEAWAAAGGAGLGPGTELDFSGDPVGTVQTITVENVGLPLSTVTMQGEWIERSGLVDEGDFLIVPAGGAEACAMPVKKAKGVTFESLIGSGAKCKVGVEFVSGITGVPGEAYVLEYGPYVFWANIKKFAVKA